MRTLVVVELGPHVVGNAADEHRRIKLGLARHTQNLTIVGIEAHHGAVAGIAMTRGLGKLNGIRQSRLAGLLNLKIQRKLNVRTGLGWNGAGLTGHVTRGVNFHGLLTTNALQQIFVVNLYARLAHNIARLIRDLASRAIAAVRRLLVLRLELLGGNGAGIAQDMAGGLAIRVLALGALGDLHAGKLTGVLLNVGDSRAAHVSRDRMQALRAFGIVLDVAQHRDIRHAEHVGKMTHQYLVVGKVAIGDDGERGAVLHQRDAVAVQDAATNGRRGNGTGLIALGLLVVVVRRDHLHAPQLNGKRGKHRTHARGEDGKAALEGRSGRIALALGGTRGRSVLRVVGKAGVAAAHDDQRDHNGHDQHDASDNNRQLGRHLQTSPI